MSLNLNDKCPRCGEKWGTHLHIDQELYCEDGLYSEKETRTFHYRPPQWGNAIEATKIDVRPLWFFWTFGKFPRERDRIHWPLESGYMGEFTIVEVDQKDDPYDMASVKAGVTAKLSQCKECQWSKKLEEEAQ